MLKEFKEFIMRGNVLDLAIAVVIGAAFGKIIASLVDDIIMPPIGLALGNVDFANLFVNLSGKDYPSVAAAKAAGAATLNYGIFFNTIFSFLIIAFVIFLLIRSYSKMQKPKLAPAPTNQGLPVLSLSDSDQGDTLRPLHFRVKVIRGGCPGNAYFYARQKFHNQRLFERQLAAVMSVIALISTRLLVREASKSTDHQILLSRWKPAWLIF